jgi:tight adherence protein C
MRIGKSRIEALRELARRTGLDDIKSLVAMLIQTERFGTSIAQSLRVFSDDMRTKRRQRAEEMSAKTSVKMVPPLVFFIFPALMVVILGPAVLMLMRQLMPVMQK